MEKHRENNTWIEKRIKDFVTDSPENNLENAPGDRAFCEPLVGFSRGDDPLYEVFRKKVGPFHLTPLEMFTITYKKFEFKPENLTVISWILPHIKATKTDNRKEKVYPSERWARARIFGEQFNEKIRTHVIQSLESIGFKAVAPVLTPQFSMRISPEYSYASTWSERHAAYAAGLGTFGLCDGLITREGKAMRTGSVITDMACIPSPRPYKDHREYCLFFTHGICGKCIPRCPAGAITQNGKNKELCYNHLFPVTQKYVTETFGFDGYGCGLCQTKVPCESRIPNKPAAR